jgi:hypothetical protein
VEGDRGSQALDLELVQRLRGPLKRLLAGALGAAAAKAC